MTTMTRWNSSLRLLGAALVVAMGLFAGAGGAVAQNNLVVVELYTSQGCSSCPPADSFFHKELAARDDVIALAWHVDYWDYIGWKDAFADPEFSERQRNYAKAAGHQSVYTPQMIIGGRDHVIGSHPEKVEGHIRDHKQLVSPVTIRLTRKGNRVKIDASLTEEAAGTGPMVVHLVRYLPREDVAIHRGENAGRTIVYANIVSEWRVLKKWDGQRDFSTSAPASGNAPVVAIIQSANYGPILAAARLR